MDLKALKKCLVDGDAAGTTAGVKAALAEGLSAADILGDCLIPGMEEVGDLFSRAEYFVPELLLSARAMTQAVELLKPELSGSGYEAAGKVVMGTVQGDMHDIGKKLVAMMLEGNGFDVIDLGADVPAQRFVETARESGATLVGLSSLLSTTLGAMEDTVKALHEAGLGEDFRVIVGGAPVTAEFASRIGADGYADDASSAVAVVKDLIAATATNAG